MEFILNNKKYSIINHELYINYLMVDSYFKDHSLYDYDIHFEFLDPIYEKEKVEFEDILEGTEILEELIENVKFCVIMTGNERDAYTLFEVLNDRAMEIDDLELIKNLFSNLNAKVSKINENAKRKYKNVIRFIQNN